MVAATRFGWIVVASPILGAAGGLILAVVTGEPVARVELPVSAGLVAGIGVLMWSAVLGGVGVIVAVSKTGSSTPRCRARQRSSTAARSSSTQEVLRSR